ncbi:MAG: glycosyltransferase family 39 protein [Methylococcales bacterium]|nr:glycosyltransferase family 39 protein [Methylococcales bacterium]
MSNTLMYRWGIAPLWMLLTLTVFLRQPLPIDETRYLSVAWEMWLRGDFWVPYLNGLAYSHKPPLLFWLFHLGWGVFGVNAWWPALVGPLAALINLWLTRKLAERLWPQQAEVALLAPWILIATLLWSLFATSAMFDILLSCFVLLGMLGLTESLAGHFRKGWIMLAVATGLGLLAKGPVIFVHLLPTAALIRFWIRGEMPSGWFAGLMLAIPVGMAIALVWAIPAAIKGGEEYAQAIFWRQVANRTLATEIHVRPFVWYLLFLPAVLFPWVYWPRFWKKLADTRIMNDNGSRFCLIWLLSGLLLFSCLSSKQIHYLIPLLPAFALLAARILINDLHVGDSRGDLMLAVVFGGVGLFLIFLPGLPWFSALHWARAVEAAWGLSVLALAVGIVLVWKIVGRLSVAVIAMAVVLAVFLSVLCFFEYNGRAFDLRPAALQLKAYNDQGVPCAYVGNYQGQFNFLGRLRWPLPVLTLEQAGGWAGRHPDGFLISVEKEKPLDAVFMQGHREYWLVFRPAGQYRQINPL